MKSVEIIAEEDLVPPGKIILNVVRAKKLEKKVSWLIMLTGDWRMSLPQGMFGKADPYVRATLANQVVRSQTINNNQVHSLVTNNIIVKAGVFS